LSFIRHSSPTLEIIFLSSIIQLSLCWKLMQSSVLLLTPFILFHAKLFICLPFNNQSFTNQLHPILFIHLFFITHSAKPHPLICHCYPSHVYNAILHHATILHLSLHEYLSNLNWFLKFIHCAHKLTKQQSSLSKQILVVVTISSQ
jgi:hypothetical protein